MENAKRHAKRSISFTRYQHSWYVNDPVFPHSFQAFDIAFKRHMLQGIQVPKSRRTSDNQALVNSRCYVTDKQIQNTHLDRQSLSYCVSLIENGVNPEALAVSTDFLPCWLYQSRSSSSHGESSFFGSSPYQTITVSYVLLDLFACEARRRDSGLSRERLFCAHDTGHQLTHTRT